MTSLWPGVLSTKVTPPREVKGPEGLLTLHPEALSLVFEVFEDPFDREVEHSSDGEGQAE